MPQPSSPVSATQSARSVRVRRGGEGNVPCGNALPLAWSLPQWLVRVAHASPLRSESGEPGTHAPHHGSARAKSGHLRRATGLGRTPGPRGGLLPEACRPAAAGGGLSGVSSTLGTGSPASHAWSASCTRPRATPVHCCRAGSLMGRRQHLCSHLGGVSLFGRRPRCAQSACGRVGDGRSSAPCVRQRSGRYGPRQTATNGGVMHHADQGSQYASLALGRWRSLRWHARWGGAAVPAATGSSYRR